MAKQGRRDISVQDSVCLLGEEWIQSVEARLDRLCPRRDLQLEGVQKACTLSSLDNENMSPYAVNIARIESIALRSQSAACSAKFIRRSGIQYSRGEENTCIDDRRANYPADVREKSFSEANKIFALTIVEPTFQRRRTFLHLLSWSQQTSSGEGGRLVRRIECSARVIDY